MALRSPAATRSIGPPEDLSRPVHETVEYTHLHEMSLNSPGVVYTLPHFLHLPHVKIDLSLQVFLDVCREKGIEPRRNYSGKFNLRIPVELHERLAIVAEAEGKSLNTLAQEALLQRVAA